MQVLLALLVFSIFVVQFSTADTFSNPIKPKDGGDPFITYSDGYYHLLTTSGVNLRMIRSETLEGLKTGEAKIVWTDSTPSRCCNIWASEAHQIDGVWYLYYSAALSGSTGRPERLHVLKGGGTPWDTYSYLGQLSTEWGIDGTVGTINGQRYYAYCCYRENLQSLCIAPMSSPSRIEQATILSQPKQDWETVSGAINEGPAFLHHNGTTFISFSASHCRSPSYSLGLLELSSSCAGLGGACNPTQLTSWAKTGPVFASGNGNFGPGHNSFFKSSDGKEDWIVYHAVSNSAGACDGTRYTMAQKVLWNADGTPNLGKPVEKGTILAGPSGE